MRAIPEVFNELRKHPKRMHKMFEELRQHCMSSEFHVRLGTNSCPVTRATGMRFFVTGGVLRVSEPRRTWMKYLGDKISVSTPHIF